MATDPYVYVGNVRKGDGTVGFSFKSTEDDTVYFVKLGEQVELNATDLARLDDRYVFAEAGEEPGSPPLIRPLEFIDEGTIPVGYVLKKTVRGFEFEPPGSWKAPVGEFAELPGSGNTDGDIRLALAEGALYYWHSAEWHELAGGGVDPPDGDFIDVPASLTGLDNGEILVWDNADARFEPGVL